MNGITVRSAPTGKGVLAPWQNHEVNASALDNAVSVLRPGWMHDCKHGQLRKYLNYYATLWRCSRTTAVECAQFNAFIHSVRYDPSRMILVGVEPNQRDQSNTSVHAFVAALKELRRRLPSTPVAIPGVVLNPSGWTWLGGYYILKERAESAAKPNPLIPERWQVDLFPQSRQHLFDLVGDFNRWKVQAGMNAPTMIRELAYGFAPGSYPTPASDAKNREIMDAANELLKQGEIVAWGWATTRWHLWPGHVSDLLNPNDSLTPLGRAFLGDKNGV
jgi:hypothetical protein